MVKSDANGDVRSETVLPPGYPTMLQKYTSCRWRLCYMIVLAITLEQSMQICMGFALVCMVGETGRIQNETSAIVGDNNTFNGSTVKVPSGEFDYPSSTQGLLISCVYYAAILSPIIGGALSRRFGPKRVMFLGHGLGAVAMILTPLAARTNLSLIILCRVIVGLVVNFDLPSSYEFWLHWAPSQERAQLPAYAYSGYSVSGLVTFTLSGFLCQIPLDNGWPFIFYVLGGCTLLWCIVWYFTVYDTPDQHPGIKEQEKLFILSNISKLEEDETKKRKVPWRNVLLSRGTLGYLTLFFFHCWIAAVIENYVPLYMATVLRMPVNLNGVLTSVGYAGKVLNIVFWTYMSRRLVTVMSVTYTRKVVQVTGYTLSGAMYLLLVFLKEGQQALSVTVVALGTSFMTVSACAGFVTPVDMSPRFASAIISVGSVLSIVASSVGPLTVAYIIPDRSKEQWAIVFYLNTSIYLVAAALFVIFGTGKRQKWDQAPQERKSSSEKTGCMNNGFVTNGVVTHF